MGIDFCRWAKDVRMGPAFSSGEDGFKSAPTLAGIWPLAHAAGFMNIGADAAN